MYYSYLLHKIKGNLIINYYILSYILLVPFKRIMYCSYLLLEIYVQYYILSYILHVTLKSDILVTYYISLLLLLYVTYILAWIVR